MQITFDGIEGNAIVSTGRGAIIIGAPRSETIRVRAIERGARGSLAHWRGGMADHDQWLPLAGLAGKSAAQVWRFARRNMPLTACIFVGRMTAA